ncbi:MAG: PDZ domain-containing protein [Akkermansiaceae bacterium]|nr:PDZ domain-containing protein [Akkermansiaceae bacterium]
MKTKLISSIATGLSAFLITPALAIDGPEDDAPPPPPANESSTKALPEIKLNDFTKPTVKEERAFLGIISCSVPEILASHLHLKSDEGVVVRSLVPDGPAAKAGIKVNDIITRVAGKSVSSPEEITKQISTHMVGEEVLFDLIHKGQPSQISVTLGNRPAEMAANDPQPLDPQDLENLPDDLADRVRGAIAGNIGGLNFQFGGLNDPDIQQMQEDAKRLLKQKLKSKMHGLSQPSMLGTNQSQVTSTSTIRMMDDQGSVEVQFSNHQKNVTLYDQQGNTIWSGPWNSEQDKNSAPADIRKRVDTLNLANHFGSSGGIHEKMQQSPLEDEEP